MRVLSSFTDRQGFDVRGNGLRHLETKRLGMTCRCVNLFLKKTEKDS